MKSVSGVVARDNRRVADRLEFRAGRVRAEHMPARVRL
jgi:hypothetical protein